MFSIKKDILYFETSTGVATTITKDAFSYNNGGADIEIANVGSNTSKTIDVTITKNSVKIKD